MTDKIVVLSACSTEEEGRRIARKLVEERLAACVVAGSPNYLNWLEAEMKATEV